MTARPPAHVFAFIENETTKERTELDLGEFYEVYGKPRDGIWIGSGEDCHVRLSGSGVDERHARHFAEGHHQFLEAISPSGVTAHGRRLLPGKCCPIDDCEFQIGPFRIFVVQSSNSTRGFEEKVWKEHALEAAASASAGEESQRPWWKFW